MSQPPNYVVQTNFNDDAADSVSGRSTVRPDAVDTELANIATSISALITNLSMIQRDDGKLVDAVVEVFNLSSDVLTLMGSGGFTISNPLGWLTATVYPARIIVTQGTGTYVSAVAHTAGVFATDLAAGKWAKIFDASSFAASGVTFTPTGTVASATVQAAIAEVASEALQIANNLADLNNLTTARSNLSVLSKSENQRMTANYCQAGGTFDVITGAFNPTVTSLASPLIFVVEATGANTTSTPTFQADATAAKTIVKGSNSPLAVGDIPGANSYMLLAFDVSLDKYVLLNPAASASAASVAEPKGRLTLTAAVPVTTTDVTASTRVYYTPYKGNTVPIYNGSSFDSSTFAEIFQDTTDTTKSPAAVAASKVYDLFVWNDAGAIRCTRGPAWTNDTTRGYTLTMTNGIYLNTSLITNGPAALRGTWVGTIFSDASNQLNDSAALRHVSNYYNRVRRNGFKSTATTNWQYQTNTFRQANAAIDGTAFRCDVLLCAAEIMLDAEYAVGCEVNTISAASIGIGIDSTTTDSATRSTGIQVSSGVIQLAKANYTNYPGAGRHTIVPLEKATGTTMTWRTNYNGQSASTGIALTVDA
jgi:hypothetical protein